jgi:hypothetical protein
MKFEKLIAISGQGSLYETVSRTKFGLIAESLETGKRIPIYAHMQVSALQDISVYTDDGELPLKAAFRQLIDAHQSAVAPDSKKSDKEAIVSFVKAGIPNYDSEKLKDSDMRKLLKWYNQLVARGMSVTDLTDSNEEVEEKPVSSEGINKPKDSKKVAIKSSTPKPSKPVSASNPRKTSTVRKTS